MSTLEEVKSAEKKMQAAQRDLQAFADRPADQPRDTLKHRMLLDALGDAINEYVRLVDELEI